MLPELTRHDLAAALAEVAAKLLEAAGITAPPVDAFAIAGACGLVVLSDDQQAGRARFVRLRRHAPSFGQGSIFLRPDPRPERLQWAVAHEIGESRAGEVFRLLGARAGEAPDGTRELVANALASHLLLPLEWFRADGPACRWDLPRLKRRYATASHELIARRMLEFDPPVIVTVFDQGRLTWRQWARAGRPPRLTAEERRCWQQAHDTGRSQRLNHQGLTMRAWAVHEPDWKREILRTELPDADFDDYG
jgi:hypothetical protein